MITALYKWFTYLLRGVLRRWTHDGIAALVAESAAAVTDWAENRSDGRAATDE